MVQVPVLVHLEVDTPSKPILEQSVLDLHLVEAGALLQDQVTLNKAMDPPAVAALELEDSVSPALQKTT